MIKNKTSALNTLSLNIRKMRGVQNLLIKKKITSTVYICILMLTDDNK